MSTPAGWYDDPTRGGRLRYWDGSQWTEWVSENGQTASEPLGAPQQPASGTPSLNLAYTYNDFRFNNDATFGNNQLPGAPRHFLRAEALYKHANGFYIGPNVEWVPQAYYVDNFNTFTTQAYAIWGLKAGVDDGKYSMYLEARNIANTAYIASTSITRLADASSPLFEPGTGRAIYAGMKVRW